MSTDAPSDDGYLSRERAANYDPAVLRRACVLIAGLGASGQNLLLTLRLLGLGRLLGIDCDEFELSNVTRSPLHPRTRGSTKHDTARKAPAVAAEAARMAVGGSSEVWSRDGFVQELGFGPSSKIDLVLSAVDRQDARAYLARQTRLAGVPLAEAGFTGEHLSFAVFANDREDEPCWTCSNREIEASALSCTAYAKNARAAGFVPAIQTGAAALAAFQAEAAIEVLHGRSQLVGKRVFLNLRTGVARVVTLARDPACPSPHEPQEIVPLALPRPATVRDLVRAVDSQIEDAAIALSSPFVLRAPCAACGGAVDVNAPLWRLTGPPLCSEPCRASSTVTDGATIALDAISRDTDEAVLALPCTTLGVGPWSVVEVTSRRTEQTIFFEIEGTIEEVFTKAGARRGSPALPSAEERSP
jgi:adenylyltransferase/sulfurtransferase